MMRSFIMTIVVDAVAVRVIDVSGDEACVLIVLCCD